jgi:hypothetical protein
LASSVYQADAFFNNLFSGANESDRYANDFNFNERFCPRKHFKVSNTSCLMYVFVKKSHQQSEQLCSSLSDYLITVEDKAQWNSLVSQLNEFKLYVNTFRIGLAFNQSSKQWQWPLHSISSRHGHFAWCNQSKITNLTSDRFCSTIGYSLRSNAWCLEKESCDNNAAFICEWRSTTHQGFNPKLGHVLKKVFFYLMIMSSLTLLMLSLFLMDFLKNSRASIAIYNQQIELLLSNRDEKVCFKKLI